MEGACKEEKCLKGGGRRGKGGNIYLGARYLERRASVCFASGVTGEKREGTTDCNEEENCLRDLEKGGNICLNV